MERGKACIVVLVVAVLGVFGCGKSSDPNPTATANEQGTVRSASGTEKAVTPANETAEAGSPEAATTEFLEAVRTGNDKASEAMFTTLARERIKELNIQVAPKGSDTAKFQVSKAEYLPPDGARVPCTWTDNDKDGKPHDAPMTWMLRKGPEGWRVAGMATVIFENEPPLCLNFEDPKETIQKLERLDQELARRTSPTDTKVEESQKPKADETIRR